MRAWMLLLGCACALATVACGDSPPSRVAWPTEAAAGGRGNEAPQGSPACDKPANKTGATDHRVQVFGKERHYTLVVPADYDAHTSYPLVYVLHGHGGNGTKARASLDLEGVADGHAIFVYPDGRGAGWDLDSPAARNGDVAFFDASLALTQSDYCVDLHRVFVAGFSNGAYMANQLACRRGDRIRGVASLAGGGPYETGGAAYDERGHLICKGKPVASLVIHGAADTTVLPSEGQNSIDHWTAANHCSGSHGTQPEHCVEYGACANRVMACKIPGLGHSLWGQAGRVTWGFFDSLK